MSTDTDFTSFGKIPRLLSDMTVTEKIDGTNAAVVIDVTDSQGVRVRAQSRKRFIEPGDDNFGFAAWVQANRQDLLLLGPGVHFGEWWGPGIQRGYGIAEKRFSLFNTDRWSDEKGERPTCCDVVPVLYQGPFQTMTVGTIKLQLLESGSVASPGFMRPEGVMVWHHRARQMFKAPFDAAPKGQG